MKSAEKIRKTKNFAVQSVRCIETKDQATRKNIYIYIYIYIFSCRKSVIQCLDLLFIYVYTLRVCGKFLVQRYDAVRGL